jgi:hypothetical protein
MITVHSDEYCRHFATIEIIFFPTSDFCAPSSRPPHPNQKQRVTRHTCVLPRFPISENIYTHTVLVMEQQNSQYLDTARRHGHLSQSHKNCDSPGSNVRIRSPMRERGRLLTPTAQGRIFQARSASPSDLQCLRHLTVYYRPHSGPIDSFRQFGPLITNSTLLHN